MLANNPASTILLASNDPALLNAMGPALVAFGAQVKIVVSAEAALEAMTTSQHPGWVVLDVNLPSVESGLAVGGLQAAARAMHPDHCFPIVLICDSVTEE